MIFRARCIFASIAAVAVLAMVASSCRAQEAEPDCDAPDYRPADLRKPMRFFSPPSAICSGNAVERADLAVGMITPDTPQAFAAFARDNPDGGMLRFVSPGGDLASAAKLGELIRKAGFGTSLGEICVGACAYAILGGVKRYMIAQDSGAEDAGDLFDRFEGATGTRLGVHQFSFSGTTAYAQQIMGRLIDYTLAMGIDPRFLALAAKTPEGAPRWLTPDEMRAWNIDNTARRYAPLSLQAAGGMGSAIGATAEVASSRFDDTTRLRLFCRKGRKTPLVALVFQPGSRDTALGQKTSRPEDVLSMLENLDMEVRFERGGTRKLAARVLDIKPSPTAEAPFQLIAVLEVSGVSFQELEAIVAVSFQDASDLSHADWSIQDALHFRIFGDRRLIHLAMATCTE
ncbi:COG3904 family protein [Roseixanthobacter liquoris]|uniref:COG3904 family protein n=1 Tax=Roseixanthobacter liquoris TaxID=3119921 RepID=UPI00372B8687